MKTVKTVPLNQQVVLPRGCGVAPKLGAIYLTAPVGFNGTPSWNFLIDPVVPLPEDFGLSEIGMQLRPRYDPQGNAVLNGKGQQVYDLWDHIGSTGYPNPSDWFLEVSKLGFHQLLSKELQFELITPETYYIATHSRAVVLETWEFYDRPVPPLEYPLCPKNIEEHEKGVDVMGMCPRLWWEGLVKGVGQKGERKVKMNMPAFEYEGYKAPEGVPLTYSKGAFFMYPMGAMLELRVYEDPETNKHEAALKELADLEEELCTIKIVPLE